MTVPPIYKNAMITGLSYCESINQSNRIAIKVNDSIFGLSCKIKEIALILKGIIKKRDR